jgi:hypothetical protein
VPSKCAAITRKGEPCRGLVRPGNDYCPAHDPARAEERRRSASKAGRSRTGGEIAEVKAQLRTLADDVLNGQVDRGTGSVTAQILGVWLKAAEVEIRERETVVKEREFVEVRLPEFQRLEGEVQELRELLAEKESRDKRGNSWAG